MRCRFIEIVQNDVHTQNDVDLGYEFPTRTNINDYKLHIQSSRYVLDFIQPDPDTQAQIIKETEDWVVEEYYTGRDYNEVYECGIKVESLKNHPVESFGGHIIVKNGHFYGIALWVEQKGGNGWHGTNHGNHCLLFVDGSIHGKNEKYESFSGEEHDSSDCSTYTLKKKSEAQEPYSKKWDI